jgi:hypothetical protein
MAPRLPFLMIESELGFRLTSPQIKPSAICDHFYAIWVVSVVRFPGVKRFPHSGHRTCSKSMRRILSGMIEHPHAGQTVFRDAMTFSRLIFCFWGTREIVSREAQEKRNARVTGKVTDRPI